MDSSMLWECSSSLTRLQGLAYLADSDKGTLATQVNSLQKENPYDTFIPNEQNLNAAAKANEQPSNVPLINEEQNINVPLKPKEQKPYVPLISKEQNLNVPHIPKEQDPYVPFIKQEHDRNIPLIAKEQDINVPVILKEQELKVPLTQREQNPNATPISNDWNPKSVPIPKNVILIQNEPQRVATVIPRDNQDCNQEKECDPISTSPCSVPIDSVPYKSEICDPVPPDPTSCFLDSERNSELDKCAAVSEVTTHLHTPVAPSLELSSFTPFSSSVVSEFPLLLTPISNSTVHPSSSNHYPPTEPRVPQMSNFICDRNDPISADFTSSSFRQLISTDSLATDTTATNSLETNSTTNISQSEPIDRKRKSPSTTDLERMRAEQARKPVTHESSKHSSPDRHDDTPSIIKKNKMNIADEGTSDLKTRHEDKNHRGINTKCDSCEAVFQSEELLNKHVAMHHGKLKCKYCPMRFSITWHLELHYVKQHDNEHYKRPPPLPVFTCDQCGKVTKGKHNHDTHMRIHLEKKFECSVCHWKFLVQKQLDHHMKLKHNPEELSYDFECVTCCIKFASKSRLSAHIMKLHKEHKCTFCGELLTGAPAMDRHLEKSHLDKATARCTMCTKTYFTQNQLKNHINYCHASRKCTECGDHIEGLNALGRHLKEKHNILKSAGTSERCYVKGCDWRGSRLNKHLFQVSGTATSRLDFIRRFWIIFSI